MPPPVSGPKLQVSPLSATGREHVSQGQPISSQLTPGSQPETSDPAALRR